MVSREEEFQCDLECGGTTSEEEGSRDPVLVSNSGRKALTRCRSGTLNFNGSSGDSDTESSDCFSESRSVTDRRVELVIERSSGLEQCRELSGLLENRNVSDQRKKPSSKKASKPPRPPKGPLLNAADLKLVKELSELTARKRARIDRMKSLRKIKEEKWISSKNNVTAMIITVLFFLIIIFQGVFSINGEVGSPKALLHRL